MFSGPARHRDRLPRINLGSGHISLPDAAATGGASRRKRRTLNVQRPISNSDRSFRYSVLKLVRCPRSLAPTLVALPSMSRVPRAPFGVGRSAFSYSVEGAGL